MGRASECIQVWRKWNGDCQREQHARAQPKVLKASLRKSLWKPKWEQGTPVGSSQMGADEWRWTHCEIAVHCVWHRLAMLYIILSCTSPLHQHCSHTSFIFTQPSVCFYRFFCLQCSYLTPSDKPWCLLLVTLPPLVPFPATLYKFGHLVFCRTHCIWHNHYAEHCSRYWEWSKNQNPCFTGAYILLWEKDSRQINK